MKLLAVFLLTLALLFPNPASAAARVAAGAKAPLEVIVLGSGGPRPFGRASASYIVMVDGTPRILMDAGPGALLRIGEMNLDLSSVDTVADAKSQTIGICGTRLPTLTADCWRNSKSLGSPKLFGVRVGKRHMGTTMISYSARRVELSPGEGR